MNKNRIIIIALVIVLCVMALITAYTITNKNSQQDYVTIALSNTSTIQVPYSDSALHSVDDYQIHHYIDNENKLNVTSFNSAEGPTLTGAVQMATIRDSIQVGSTPIVTEDNITVYQDPNTKVYSIFTGNDNTHDNILIVSDDLETLLHAYKSITYGQANETSEDNTPSTGNNSQRYVEDENGLFDNEKGVYVNGLFEGMTKGQVKQYIDEIGNEPYDYDYYDYYDYEYYPEYDYYPSETPSEAPAETASG